MLRFPDKKKAMPRLGKATRDTIRQRVSMLWVGTQPYLDLLFDAAMNPTIFWKSLTGAKPKKKFLRYLSGIQVPCSSESTSISLPAKGFLYPGVGDSFLTTPNNLSRLVSGLISGICELVIWNSVSEQLFAPSGPLHYPQWLRRELNFLPQGGCQTRLVKLRWLATDQHVMATPVRVYLTESVADGLEDSLFAQLFPNGWSLFLSIASNPVKGHCRSCAAHQIQGIPVNWDEWLFYRSCLLGKRMPAYFFHMCDLSREARVKTPVIPMKCWKTVWHRAMKVAMHSNVGLRKTSSDWRSEPSLKIFYITRRAGH